MRIILFVILFFLPFVIKTDANGVNDLNYKFYVIPIAGPETAELEMVLKNEGDIPLHFEFPTSQIYEITITDQTGKEVYVYSKGKYFLQAFQTITLEPYQTYKRIEKWNYQFQGKRVPSGDYTVHVSIRPTRLNDEPIQNRSKLNSVQVLYVPEENTAFRHVKVSGTKGNYVVTGETRSANGVFYYAVEDGHVEYISEKQVLTKASKQGWETFQIQIEIPKQKLPNNGSLIVNIYERSDKGQFLNTYPIMLERF